MRGRTKPPDLLTPTLSSTQTWRRGRKTDLTCDVSRDVDVDVDVDVDLVLDVVVVAVVVLDAMDW
jgi:hypothetical protein